MNPGIVILVLIVGVLVYAVWKAARDSGGWDFLGFGYTPPVPSRGSVADYLVDPDTKLPFVYVVDHAVIQEYGRGPWIVYGKMGYGEKEVGTQKVKLIRSGTGFRVYGHPEVKDGTWLPCR
jgi:cytochrome bd-type quinol oxidase subunit 1